MWVRDTVPFKVRNASLLAFCVCGIAGVLVDIDHIIANLLLPELSGRFLHTPLLIASSVVLCGLGAYLGGLFCGLVLTKGKKTALSHGEA